MSKERLICPHCGGAVDVLEGGWDPATGWLQCIKPEGFEWYLPSGKIVPVIGPVIYTTADGEKYTREEYLTKYNIDPETALEKMRSGR